MNLKHDIEGGWSDEQRRAREAVRALSTPLAAADFRARLRTEFVQGDFSGRTDVVSAPRGPRRSMGRRRLAWVAPLALAASLAIAVGIANRGPGWDVVHASGSDHVLIDGAAVACDDLSPLEAALHPGCRIQVPEGGQLEVTTDVLALQINGGVEMTLPASPGRWVGRQVASEVEGEGRLRVVTRDGFEGARYALRTGPTELVVTGTAFSVMRNADVVCICVLEGEVRATMPDGSMRSIGSGGRLTLARDGSSFDEGDMEEVERVDLVSLLTKLETHGD